MKKILIITITLFLSGCDSTNKTNKIILPTLNPNPVVVGEYFEIEEKEIDSSSIDHIKVDHDLSKLSKTMSYAYLTRITDNPEDYLNETVKLRGVYYSGSIPDSDEVFHGIMLLDEAACCMGYIDIRLPSQVPYPEELSEMVIIGKIIKWNQANFDYHIVEVTDYVF